MDRHLSLETIRVTEAAALAAARWMGRGDQTSADRAAVEAMRREFNHLDIHGTIVIGEGERDEAPMLFIGEVVGRLGPSSIECVIAVDPLEGTRITAHGGGNALSVLAIGRPGALLHAPDTYMNKIAVGREAAGVIDLAQSATENLNRIAEAKGMQIGDLTVAILDRPRHEDLIAEVRRAGARIRLILDGDVSAAVAAAVPGSNVDVLMGIGGAPEGVLAAAALRALGGNIQGQLAFRNDGERQRAIAMGIQEPGKVFRCEELAGGDVVFAASGVTDGDFLKGVRFDKGGATTSSVVMRSATGTVRYVTATHDFSRKSRYRDYAAKI
jgi:fructose-1,6-bisphosphatase II